MNIEADKEIDRLIKRHEASWREGYDAFPAMLNKLGLKRGVEVGVAFGGHAGAILERGGVDKLYGVDRYRHQSGYDDPMNLPQPVFDRLANRVIERMKPFENRFQLIREDSEQAGQQFKAQSLDFVYLDADHSEQGVWKDLCTWAIKVREGGVIAGHDFGHPDFPGVQHAVERFFKRFGWAIHEEGHGVWWVKREHLPITYFTPCYNCADSLRASAESILKNHIKPGDEYILVNDGSSDATADVLNELAVSYPVVKVIHHPNNRGGAAARNTAIEAAQNALCFCLDADNLLLPGSIDALRKKMLKCDADIIAFQETTFFTDETGTAQPTHSHVLEDQVYGLPHYLSTHRVPGSGGNYLFSKACWQAVGGYPQDAHALDTWGFGLRLAGAGFKTAIAPGTAYLHRSSPDSYWNRHVQAGTVNQDAYRLLTPYLDQIHPADARYLASEKGRERWFTNIESRPIRTRCSMQDSRIDKPIVCMKKSLDWFRRKLTSPAHAA